MINSSTKFFFRVLAILESLAGMMAPRENKNAVSRLGRPIKTLMVISLASLLALPSFAQDDFFGEDEFDIPPPGFSPPPPFDPNASPDGFDGGSRNEPIAPPPPGNDSGPRTNSNPRLDSSKRRQTKPKFSEAFPEEITNENFPDLIESFDYPNAEITDVVKAISELTGKNFIVDPNIRGKITIMAPTQITVAEAYKAFLSALAINNYTVVPYGKFLKIIPTRNAQRDSLEIYSGDYSPNTDQMITRIVHLRHITSTEMRKFLQRFVSNAGVFEVYEPTNTIIISDLGANINRITKIIDQIDNPGFEEQLEVLPIRHAKAEDIADLIDQIINKDDPSRSRSRRGSFRAGVPRFTAPGQSGTAQQAYSLVIPDERTNSIIIVGNKDGIKKIKDLVMKLDFNMPLDQNAGIHVYYVKHGEAKKLADTLNGITEKGKDNQNQPGPNTPPPAFSNPMGFGQDETTAGSLQGKNIKVSADETSNSLIITSPRQDYEVILNLLAKLDRPRDQVYVEAIIMEMSAEGSQDYGISYYNFIDGTNGLGRSGFSSGNFGTLSDIGASGAILGFANGGNVQINAGGSQVTVKSLTGFINFIKSTTKTNVLSTPQVLAYDNQEAQIEVGEEVPVGTNVTQGAATAQTSIQFRKATIRLKIKPYISPDSDRVRMEIDQAVDDISAKIPRAEQLRASAQGISTRTIKTMIAIPDQDTAVLGGLIRDLETEQTVKIPILGDIPLLGWLFKGQKTRKEKVNLFVFITPRILRNTEDTRQVLGKKLQDRIDFVKKEQSGEDQMGHYFEDARSQVEGTKQKQ
ncbi:MAG: type II secretion system protein GspD [Bdellovibrionales bacterium CG10_big_fil_rev_8_21_14_0_10_45_34]|nr:MAG: type II secretion system protein GspD [Bdellovibrionales bacterium CG10_big_fil_rev_8_21_14_0_10_45_34]